MCPSPRPEIIGTKQPQAAAIGANKKLTLSPTPPVECLSITGPPSPALDQSKTFPECAIAFVREPVSSEVIDCSKIAIAKAGLVATPMNVMMAPDIITDGLQRMDASCAIVDADLWKRMGHAFEAAGVTPVMSIGAGPEESYPSFDDFIADQSIEDPDVTIHSDDIWEVLFTSGTTGSPKATMHFHRDVLMIADGYAKEVLGVTPDDVFVGSPPLAFTFGLGGLAVFPLRFGAAATLLEQATPPNMIEIIETYRATVCFTAPTAYRAMLAAMEDGADLSSLRAAVSAGETLPAPVYDDWIARTGKPMLDGIGATEMLHIFISNRFDDHRPACTGRPVTGYEARVVDDRMVEVPRGTPGRLAVRGPTGCRYLADDRQKAYVQDGWNITGDTFWQDEDGRFHFAARNDDMIISAGYNIAGPEVEAALLSHPMVAECAVVGAPDPDRGEIVSAHVVLKPGIEAGEATARLLQDHVKAAIAPYKYPRKVVFREALPKTETGKIQRFRLKGDGNA